MPCDARPTQSRKLRGARSLKTMPIRYHIGISDLKNGLEAYAKRFDFCELAIAADVRSTIESPRTTPATATLRRWRKVVPPHFDFCVVAPPELGRLKAGPGFEMALAVSIAAINALQARTLLIRTPRDVTPALVWRNRFAQLLERLPRDSTRIVWEPTGLWEVADAAVAAKKWGVVLCVDAARDPVPHGDVAYVRLRALGETRSFGESALERVVVAIGAKRDAYVVIESTSARREAGILKRIVESLALGAAGMRGGFGRVIRPKTALGADEEE